ncbi:MAG: DUF4097 domain-containing protein [Lactobacillaceae bacterium]|nr:DUF4097 domain-containing protein [Lactobacillaceae bacterium]
MNENLKTAVDKLFADYEMNQELQDFKDEVLSDLEASTDLIKEKDSKLSDAQVVKQALSQLGDLKPVIESITVIDEANNSQVPPQDTLTKDFEIAGLLNIDIDTSTPRVLVGMDTNFTTVVSIKESTDSKVHVVYNSKNITETLDVAQTDTDLRLTLPELNWKQRWSPFKKVRMTLEVSIPKKYAGAITLNANHSDIKVSSLDNKKSDLFIHAQGSRLKLNDLTLNSIDLHASGAQVFVTKVDAVDFSSEVNAADVIYRATKAKFNLSSEAGSIKMSEIKGQGIFSNSAGYLNIEFDELLGHVELESEAGENIFKVDPIEKFNFELAAKAGTVDVKRDATFEALATDYARGTTAKNAKNNIKAQIYAGTIELR